MLKISAFYHGKQKSFDPKKIRAKPSLHARIVLLVSNNWPYPVLTFLIHSFYVKKSCVIFMQVLVLEKRLVATHCFTNQKTEMWSIIAIIGSFSTLELG
jgi:hypothetical protein